MQTLTIGRDTSNSIVLNNDFVSRQHAQLILYEDGQALLKDLNSSNGTFVNGNKITESYLSRGDSVKCGNAILNWDQYVKPITSTPPLINQLQSASIQEPKISTQFQPQYQQNVIIIGKQKSVGVAFLLAFLFGPLGLLYASVVGGIVMFFAGIILFIVIPIIGGVIAWVGCVIWAVVAAGNANKNAINKSRSAPFIQNQY